MPFFFFANKKKKRPGQTQNWHHFVHDSSNIYERICRITKCI